MKISLLFLLVLLALPSEVCALGGTSGTGTGTSLTGGGGGSSGNADTLLGLGTTAPQNPQVVTRTGVDTYTASNVYNVLPDAASLPHFRKCLSNVQAGTGRCRILAIGDSTTFGVGTTNISRYNWPAQLSNILSNAFGVPSDYDSWIGNSQNTGGSGFRWTQDPRITFGGSWADGGIGVQIVGGNSMTNPSAGSGSLSFTANKIIDTCKYWYLTNTGASLGTLGIQIDSGSVTSISENVTGSFASQNLTATPAKHTCTMTHVTGGAIYVGGFEAWDSTHPGISVINTGWSGSDTTSTAPNGWNNTTDPYGPGNSLGTVAGELNLLDLDLNDANNSVTVSVYKTRLQTMITKLLLVGDVVLVTSSHANTLNYTDASIAPYIAAVYQLAASNNIPLIDNWTREVSYTYSNNNGWINATDHLHMTGQGYADFAQGIASFIIQVVGQGSGLKPPVTYAATISDVNALNLSSAATGVSPSITSISAIDTNVGISILPQGTGGVAVGTSTTTAGQFTLQNAAAHAGQTTCWTTGGAIGYCTSVVGVGGACTCTGL